MAIIANLYIDQGTDYEVTIDCTDDAGEVLDLTGYTAGNCTNKKNLWFFYIASLHLQPLSLHSGQVTLGLSDTQTSAMEW